MKFYEDYEKGSEIFLDDLIYQSYNDYSLNEIKRTAAYIVNQFINQDLSKIDLMIVATRAHRRFLNMSLQEIQSRYNELININYKPQVIYKAYESLDKNLFETLDETSIDEPIYLSKDNLVSLKLYKCDFFKFEDDYYLIAKDKKGNLAYYKYIAIDDYEALELINDPVLISILKMNYCN